MTSTPTAGEQPAEIVNSPAPGRAENETVTISLFKPGEKAHCTPKAVPWSKLFTAMGAVGPTTIHEKEKLGGWAPATFQGNYRKKENVLQVYAAVFDIDNACYVEEKQPDGKLKKVKRKLPEPQIVTVDRALSSFPGVTRFLYTSWSHRADWPHFRLVVPYTRPVNGREQECVWDHLASRFKAAGLAIDAQCKDASRLWFLPARRDAAFFAHLESGPFLDVDAILAATATAESDGAGEECGPGIVPDFEHGTATDVGIEAAEPENRLEPADVPLSERRKRASKYLAKMPAAVSGAGGHEATIKAATALTRGFALPAADAFTLLKDEFNPRCEPAWSDRELQHKIDDAAKCAKVPLGYLLTRARTRAASPSPTEADACGASTTSGAPGTGAHDASTIDLLIDAIEKMHPYRILTGRVFVNLAEQALPVDGQKFVHRVAHAFRREHQRNVTETAIKNALLPVLGEELPPGQAPIRYADDGAGGIWLDLARKDGRAVRITKSGCETTSARIAFYRPEGTRPMPVPVLPATEAECAGILGDYYTMLGLGGDANWHARVACFAWQVSSMRPMEWGSRFGCCEDGGDEADARANLTAYTVMPLAGAEGCGKSTRARYLCKTIDAREPDVTALPEKIDDLVIVAENTHLMSFDNASALTKEMSDALCRTATGDGNRKRSLYSNRDLSVFRGSRPLMLNGITDVVREADLLDRSLVVRLEPLPRRKTERELAREFTALWPRVLGALCYCVSKALARLEDAAIPEEVRTIRMIDACMFATAAEEVAGFKAGAVVAAYKQSKAEAVVTVAEDPVVAALFAAVAPGASWEGTTAELLDELTLERKGSDGKRPLPKRWPSEARGLTGALKRLQTTLVALGFGITFPAAADGGRDGKQRILTITRSASQPAWAGAASAPRARAAPSDDDIMEAQHALADGRRAPATSKPMERTSEPPDHRPSELPHDENGLLDGSDGSDGRAPESAHDGDHGGCSGVGRTEVHGLAGAASAVGQNGAAIDGTDGTVGNACPQAHSLRRSPSNGNGGPELAHDEEPNRTAPVSPSIRARALLAELEPIPEMPGCRRLVFDLVTERDEPACDYRVIQPGDDARIKALLDLYGWTGELDANGAYVGFSAVLLVSLRTHKYPEGDGLIVTGTIRKVA